MPRFRLGLTAQIFIGLVIGVIVGAIVHAAGADEEVIAWLRVPSRIFLALIKVIIAPLLFSTLVVGIAGAGHPKAIGRIGFKAMVYFEVVTTIALVIGLVAVNLVRPGDGVNLPLEMTVEAQEIAARVGKMSAQDHIVKIFPPSVIKAMAENDVLGIVSFSLLFAVACGAIGKMAQPVVEVCESLAQVMFRFTNMIMRFAPIGVGAAMAVTVAGKGLGVLKNLGLLVLTLYGALAVFIVVVLGIVALIIRLPLRPFWQAVREPLILAFTTTSSESAFPKALENMERFGVPKRIVAFVLPLGYSFNLDGSTLYMSLAAIFVAQAANVELTMGQQVLMVLTLMLTSKGIAAVPRASLVVLSGTLVSFNLPLEGVALILGVDELMDMARTGTNVLGNCVATTAVARWEGVRDMGTRPMDVEPVITELPPTDSYS